MTHIGLILMLIASSGTVATDQEADVKDQHGFSRSDMTAEGWRDYNRALAEVASQRGDRTSRYNGVARVHCADGYVDVRQHGGAVENGSSVAMTVDEYRAYIRPRANIYDYCRRPLCH